MRPAFDPLDQTWCYFCDRPRNDCACHLDPNGIPENHWSLAQQDAPLSVPCARCGHEYGLHEHLQGRCLQGNGYSRNQTFQSVDELEALITAAEESHIAAGMLVDVRAEELADAVMRQVKTRRKLEALRQQQEAVNGNR